MREREGERKSEGKIGRERDIGIYKVHLIKLYSVHLLVEREI